MIPTRPDELRITPGYALGRAVRIAKTSSRNQLAETVASLQLHAAAASAVDTELAHELRLTADEESTHAVLAYRIALCPRAAPRQPAVRAVRASCILL